MRSRVQMWGNSLGLRIPKRFADDTGLVPGAEIDLEVVDGSLVVRPVMEPPTHSPSYSPRSRRTTSTLNSSGVTALVARSGNPGFFPMRRRKLVRP